MTFPQIVGVINTAADVHGPDGAHTVGRSCDLTGVGGISGYLNGNNTPGLVGVFLGPAQPGSAPARLDFSTAALGENFTALSPLLGQVFFIGDGVTNGGITQQFAIPSGATRLFFGIPDGNSSNAIDNATLYHGSPNKYADNTGSISLRAILAPGPTPTITSGYFPLSGGQIDVFGGIGPYTVAVLSGALPAGMSISTSGLVTGTPAGGPYNFTLRVTDSLGTISDHAFSGDIGPVLSTFDSNVDGWTASGDPAGPPQFFATGGNPAGRIRVTDAELGGYVNFEAPAKFLGNQSEKYGGTLSFDLMQSYSGAANQADGPDVTLVSGLLTLVFDTTPNPANNAWTSYSVALTETAGWKVGSLTGPVPTQAQMQSVLGNLSALRIRAEFQGGPDTDSLDNVSLEAPISVSEITVEQPVGTPLTDSSGSVLFGTYNLGTPVEMTFTISNSATATGNLNLTGTKPTVDGTHGSDFVAGDYGSTSLAPGASTTVTVTFTPTATGTRTAELHIISNDADETSFDILMEGAGSVPIGVEAVSTFDTDTDGWTAVGDIATNALFSATGGNPGGHIYVIDAATNGMTRFNAPAKFLGNQSGKYGGTLSFDLSQTYPGAADQINETDIVLVGNGMTLVYDTSPNPAKDAWTSYSISMTETAGWKIDSLTGSAPSQAQMQAVLGNLTSLRIRSEFQTGDDTGSLDNVRLVELTHLPEIAVEYPLGMSVTNNASIILGNQAMGLQGPAQTFTILNPGNSPLTISNVGISGGNVNEYALNTTGMATSIPAGGSTTFSIRFTPVNLGARTTTLTIVTDDADEASFVLNLRGDGVAPASGAVAFASATQDVPEGGIANIMLTRTGGIDGEATVRVSSTAGTAKAADFTPLVNQIVTFPNGISTVSVPVNITADTLSEAHETFTLKLSSPTTATLGTLTTTTVRIIDSIDTKLPSVAVLLPLPHVRANITASGTAKDDKGVSRVVYSWNNGPLLDVPDLRISTNGLSASWHVPLVCNLGTNTLRVSAIDTRGNSSKEVVQTYNSILRPITVNQTGPANSGTLSSLFPTTRDLLVGFSFTVVATPKPGFVFGGWSANSLAGTNTTPAMLELPSLTFTHQEGLVLNANFIATPFTAAVLGTYNGLIIPSAELPAPGGSSAGDDTVGFITCTLGANGSLTGNLRINGMDKRFESFIALCDIEGDVRFSTKRLETIRFSPNIELALHFDLTDGTQKLTGTLTRKTRHGVVIAVSKVSANRSPFSTTNKVSSSYAGTTSKPYTLRLKPRASQGPGFDLEHYPQGDGFGSLTVKADGSVTSILNLPDGTTATSSARLSTALQMPLFVQLYGARGSISAQVQLDEAQTNSDALPIPFTDRPDLDGLLWFRPMLDVQHYPYGWDEGIFTDLIACKYNKATPLPGLGPVNSTSGNLDLNFSGGELISSLIKFVNFTPTGTASKAPPTDTSFTIKVTAASGSMSGTLTHSSSTPTTWQGVLLQKGANRGGFGYFRTNTPAEIDYTGQTGSVILQPK